MFHGSTYDLRAFADSVNLVSYGLQGVLLMNLSLRSMVCLHMQFHLEQMRHKTVSYSSLGLYFRGRGQQGHLV
jgi:hypothetical protein